MKLQAHGIETDLPVGWEGRIAMRTPTEPDTSVLSSSGSASTEVNRDARGAERSAGGQVAQAELHFPVAHLANFPLPEDRGDFGSGAVDIMTVDDVLLVLAEFGPECANTPLFAPRDFPTNLTPNMFSGSALQRSHQGQAGCQIFFTHANRAFCLYTVLGRQSSAARVLPQANATLAATRITPR